MVSNPGPSAYQPNALPLGQTGSRGMGGVRRAQDGTGAQIGVCAGRTGVTGLWGLCSDRVPGSARPGHIGLY